MVSQEELKEIVIRHDRMSLLCIEIGLSKCQHDVSLSTHRLVQLPLLSTSEAVTNLNIIEDNYDLCSKLVADQCLERMKVMLSIELHETPRVSF